MTENTNSLRSNLYWNTSIPILVQGLKFVFTIWLARILMPSDFGIMAIAMLVIGYANLLANFSFNQVLIQKRLTETNDLNSLFTLGLMLAVILIAIVFLTAHHIALFFNSEKSENVMKVMASIFIISAIRGIAVAILQRDMNFKVVSLMSAFQTLFASVLTLVLAIVGLNFWALAWGQLIPLLVSTIILCRLVHWLPSLRYDYSFTRNILHFSLWNYFRSQMNFIAGHIEIFIVGKFMNPVQVGIYDKAASFATQPQSVINMNINSVFFSIFCKNKKFSEELQLSLKKNLSLLGLINVPVYFGLICIAPYFVNVLLGEKWQAMIIPLQILCLSAICNSFTSVAANLNVAIGKYSEHTKKLFVLILFFIFSMLFAVNYGLVGVACAALLFNLLKLFFLLGLALKNASLSWYDFMQTILPCFIASFLMLFVNSIASVYWLNEYSFINMILIIIIGAFVYAGYIFFIDRSIILGEFKNAVRKDLTKIAFNMRRKNDI